MHVLVHLVSRMCFSPEASLIFALCFLPSAACSLKRTKKHRRIEITFLGVCVAHFEVEGVRNFGSGYVSQNSRFYHVLSVSVVPSVSVESVIESVMCDKFYTRGHF